MILCFSICYIAPSFNNFIGFIGSFVLIFLGIILPPLTYLKAFKEELSIWTKAGLVVILVVNTGVWIAATWHSLKNFASE
jgi:hypothetical protein